MNRQGQTVNWIKAGIGLFISLKKEIFAGHALECLIQKELKMPPCEFKRGNMCTLTRDKCRWARCPYTPERDLTVELRTLGGRIERRTLATSGEFISEYFDDEEEMKSSDNTKKLVQKLLFDPIVESAIKAGQRCMDCNKLLTREDIMHTQGHHCVVCWDRLLEKLQKNPNVG